MLLDNKTTGKLVICSTPIGNLADITIRAKTELSDADVVYAEDTRVTTKLLRALQIEKPVKRMDEESISKHAHLLISDVGAGKRVVFCSDAGMPGVSDPGMRLVSLAYECGIHVEVLPGASGVLTAYVYSGFNCASFYFGGFLPRKKQEKLSLLQSLSNLGAVLIFFESPKRLVASLCAISTAFPNRNVCVCREMTKIHEEIVCDNSRAVLKIFEERSQRETIKGEIAIVIDTFNLKSKLCDESDELVSCAKKLAHEMIGKGLSVKDVTSILVKSLPIKRNDAYSIASESSLDRT